MTFKVGDRVRAARDITSGELAPSISPWPMAVRIAKGTQGAIERVYEAQRFDCRVHFDTDWKWDVKAHWLEPADAPADADVVVAIVAALEAELKVVTESPAFPESYRVGLRTALNIVREVGKVQP